MPPIQRILIANRGEIALRVLRACRELGIEVVAVYSDADRASLHVLEADAAYRLGPAPSAESYLRGDRILEIAREAGADAIHPGYGFLSENADFAERCEQAGVTFIGPTARAMRVLGAKTSAREAADRAGVPRTPGSTQALRSREEAYAVAREIGYPVMLKAAAGGGGKGMRAVAGEEELEAAFYAARSEAERAFGSDAVYLEKLIERPRHIEIQVLADAHGHAVYLGERECSVQRRHQKVIEEAPSAAVAPGLRRRMGEAACRLALREGYTNAGTVEFLLDADGSFYFLEMNTRLQVEHPVTELVTGLDLVHLQIAIAEGKPLPLSQEEIALRGHAIECRIYAEDPDNHFFPSPGQITRLRQPGGPGIREDSGVYEGWTVPMEYDPMLSKLVAYAPTRELALARMRRAMGEYAIDGIKTNLPLFRRILRDEAFCRAEIDTGYLDRLLAVDTVPDTLPAEGETTAGEAYGPESAEVHAMAAALFEVLARSSAGGSGSAMTSDVAATANGTGPNMTGTNRTGANVSAGEWKRIGRREALRS